MTKRILAIGSAAMATLLALAVVWQLRVAVVYVLISLTLAAVLRPLATRLIGRSTPERVAWLVLYVLAAGCLGLMLFVTGTHFVGEIQVLARSVSEHDAWTLPVWLANTWFEDAIVATLPEPSKLFEAVTGSEGQLMVSALLGLVRGIGGLIGGVLVISFLSIYWSISQAQFERLWLSLLPSDQRAQARAIWQLVESQLGAYIRSQMVHSLLVGVLLGAGYSLLGSPYPALLAAAGALASLLPVVGAELAITVAVLVGLLTSAQLSLITGLWALVVVGVVGVWVMPRLTERKWNNPILTTVLLIALADAMGVLGILVAPALSVVCQILWRHLVGRRRPPEETPQISDLVERQERARAIIEAMDGPPPHMVSSSMGRLNDLIERARPILEEVAPQESAGAVAAPPVAD
jgi:predicted PurR-regulated permease PerM